MNSLYITMYFFVTLDKYGFTFQLKKELNDEPGRISETATLLANENFNFRLQTVVISRDVDDKIVDNFLKTFNGTVVIEVKREGIPPTQVVIFLESAESFRKILDILKPDLKGKSLLHSGTKFIIAIFKRSHRIHRIFQTLWSYYVVDVVLIASYKKNLTALYTYFPYINRTNCQNTDPFLIGLNIENSSRTKAFPDKLKNMKECPLYVSTNKLHSTAIEKKIPLIIIKNTMLQLLQRAMNFTPVITYTDNTNTDSDKFKSDSLSDVMNGIANISSSGVLSGLERLTFLDYTFPYFRIKIVWLAPPTKPGQVWLRLFCPLNGYMWLILLILLCFLKSLPFVLRMKPVENISLKYFKGIQNLKGVAFRIWGMLVGQPIRIGPRRFRDFYIIGVWMWFTFVVRSAYQSVLIGALKTETVVGNFVSLKEAADNGYKFGGKAGILVYFEHDRKIRDEFEIVPETRFKDVFDNILEGKNKFVLATSLEDAQVYCLLRGIKENECGYVVPDSIVTIPLVVWMRKHSPFLRPVSIWLTRLFESGLMERDTIKAMKIGTRRKLYVEPTPLTRTQTLSCFLCLLIGYILSCLVFCFETLKYFRRDL